MGRDMHVDDEVRSAESISGVYDWRQYRALESDCNSSELVGSLPFSFPIPSNKVSFKV